MSGDAEFQAQVRACLAGNDGACAACVRELSRILSRAASRHVANLTQKKPLATDVEDIVQDLLVRLFERDALLLRRLAEAPRFYGYLVVMAQNRVVDYLRQSGSASRLKGALAEQPAREHAASPDAHAIAAEESARMQSLVETLPPLDRAIVALYYQHNRTYAQIGEMLDMNINTVASRLHRARQRLRGEFEGLDDAPAQSQEAMGQ